MIVDGLRAAWGDLVGEGRNAGRPQTRCGGRPAQVAVSAGSPRTTRTSGRVMEIFTLRLRGTSQKSSRRMVSAMESSSAESSLHSSLVAMWSASSSNRAAWVSRLSASTSSENEKKAACSSSASRCGSRALSAVTSGSASLTQPQVSPAKARSAGENDREAPGAGGFDCKRHADRAGTGRQRGRGGPRPFGHGELVERPRPAVAVGDFGGDARDAVEPVVPAVAVEALVGFEELLRHAGALYRAP